MMRNEEAEGLDSLVSAARGEAAAGGGTPISEGGGGGGLTKEVVDAVLNMKR